MDHGKTTHTLTNFKPCLICCLEGLTLHTCPACVCVCPCACVCVFAQAFSGKRRQFLAEMKCIELWPHVLLCRIKLSLTCSSYLVDLQSSLEERNELAAHTSSVFTLLFVTSWCSIFKHTVTIICIWIHFLITLCKLIHHQHHHQGFYHVEM